MNSEDRETLKMLGYQQYAEEPYEKFSRMMKASPDAKIRLRIRTTSDAEKQLYHASLSALARSLDGSVFGEGFECFFGDSVEELDRLMMEDAEKWLAKK